MDSYKYQWRMNPWARWRGPFSGIMVVYSGLQKALGMSGKTEREGNCVIVKEARRRHWRWSFWFLWQAGASVYMVKPTNGRSFSHFSTRWASSLFSYKTYNQPSLRSLPGFHLSIPLTSCFSFYLTYIISLPLTYASFPPSIPFLRNYI